MKATSSNSNAATRYDPRPGDTVQRTPPPKPQPQVYSPSPDAPERLAPSDDPVTAPNVPNAPDAPNAANRSKRSAEPPPSEASQLLNHVGIRTTADENTIISQKILANSKQSFTGYAPDVQEFHERLNAIFEGTQRLSPPRRDFYEGEAATLSGAFSNESDLGRRNALTGMQDQLLDHVTSEAATFGTTDEGIVSAVFNAPPGVGLLANGGQAERQKLSGLWQTFRAGDLETQHRAVSDAIAHNAGLRQQINPVVDALTGTQNSDWKQAFDNADNILQEAATIKDPGMRYESIGRKLFANRMSDNPQKSRELLAFTERMKSPEVAEKLNTWHVDAAGPLNTEGVGAPPRYTDILKNLPEPNDSYVENLAKRYNEVLHDATEKDISITPAAKTERIVGQVFEGISRFITGLVPFGDRLISESHSSLSADARAGINWASAFAGLGFSFGEVGSIGSAGTKAVAAASEQAVRLGGAGLSSVEAGSEIPRLLTFEKAVKAAPSLAESEPLRLRGGGGAIGKMVRPVDKIDPATDLVRTWVNQAAATQADMPRLHNLITASNAEERQSILDYVEAGQAEINSELRSGRPPRPNTLEFLHALHDMHDYSGTSYRVSRVRDDGLAVLKRGKGGLFSDAGVQSASILPAHAREWATSWARDQAGPDTHELITIFDETVPQKNLSTGTLADHVAVPPLATLKLTSLQTDGPRYFAFFSGPGDARGPIRDIFTGAKRTGANVSAGYFGY